jgi:hypothetical protein
VPRQQIQQERREQPTNTFYFGKQKVTTKVFMMAPREHDAISVDVVDFLWESNAETQIYYEAPL